MLAPHVCTLKAGSIKVYYNKIKIPTVQPRTSLTLLGLQTVLYEIGRRNAGILVKHPDEDMTDEGSKIIRLMLAMVWVEQHS